MNQSIVAILIICCLFILYLTDVFSVAVTTMIGMIAMVFAGILTFSEAFTCFSNSSVMLVLGMIIVVDALLESGVGGRFGRLLARMVGNHERSFVIAVFLSAAFFSGFMTNAPLVAMYMSFIAAIADASDGVITKKNTYLPLAMGALIGGTGTLIGSTAPLLANNVLATYGAETMTFFTPMQIALACVCGASLAMATPVASTSITMVEVAGYRFKDYFRVGGLVGVIGLATAWVAIVVQYGLLG